MYIFEIIDGDPEPHRALKIKTKELYNKAIQHYKKRDFENSLNMLNKIHAIDPADQVIHLYIERCERFIKSGVPEHWDGVESFDFKF